VSGFADVQDDQEASGVELSENVAEDVVEYLRGNIVGHEQNGLLMYFSVLSGWGYGDDFHTNVIGMGPPGSGKSLTKNKIRNLVDEGDAYTKTDATSNAILDSREWDLSVVAILDEYDKVNRDIIEVLKSSNPEDGGYAKDRNVEDPDARGGYSPTEVSADANPWVLLYAPSSKKGGINDELEDRALILYFSNDKFTRRGIGRKEFGHEDINVDTADHEYEYIYDTHALAARLRKRLRSLPVDTKYEENEDDDQEYLASRVGDTSVYIPHWCWYACEPIFNLDDDATNRVYGLVVNLIKASALLNHDRRERKEMEVYVDADSTETETREAVVVGPQDVANVLCCLPTLLSTTHELTPLKRHILDAVRATEPATDADGTTVTKVQNWLETNDIPHPSRSTLKSRLDELDEDYYLNKYKSCAGPKGQADAYQIAEHGALEVPNVSDLQRHADRDGIELATEDCVHIDPEDPFADCSDPIRDQPFVDTVTEFRAEFVGETVEEDSDILVEAMGGPVDGDVTDHTDDGDSQQTLTDESADMEDAGSGSVELDPEGDPDDLTEQWVFEACQEQAGTPFGQSASVEQYLGLVDPDTTERTDTEDSPLNPDHDLWQVRPDLKDDRVISESDAKRELSDAFGRLKQKGLVALDDDGGPPAMSVLRVAKESTE